MDELELVGLHEDGERLVLAARDGAQSTLPITDALRAAIRGDRPRTESIRAQEASALRPREIQERLRAGETCEQLAEVSGLPIEHVRRFEYAVLSEREHSIARVRGKSVLTDDGGATTLGEVADDRLRSRGVRPSDARWTATREGTQPWVVQVEFQAGDRPRVARWSLEPRGGFVTALDDEARWLGLPEEDERPAVAGVSALPSYRSNHPSSRSAPPEQDDTDLLLDNLSERRGQRPARRHSPAGDLPDMMELDLDGADGAGGPDGPPAEEPEPDPAPSAAVVDLGARRGGSRPRMPSPLVPDSPADLEWEGPSQWEIDAPRPGPRQEADAGGVQGPSPADRPAPQAEPEQVPEKPPAEPAEPKRPASKRGRKSRAQVPSWDEIVFGSRPEV
ncbi:septation protein SepH [Promicromonospora sp. NPDC060271]|uniref:septation protein SepH n=1 Tax=Promicromonospora sp. NPDC060271 TaxID=3347089 RepID=UPI0036550235